MIRLDARGLTLRTGTRTLIHDINIEFAAGENWAILGANGSGKTTLLLALAGLRAADAGTVRLDQVPLQEVSRRERARQLGLLFQDAVSAFPSTVREQVLSGRHPHLGRWQEEGPDDFSACDAALAALGLQPLAARTLQTLSGGERRRVDVATLLAQDPPICLLDEPSNHLDPHHQLTLVQLAAQRATRANHLNLFVLHDVNLAARCCSHALLLRADGSHQHGRIQTVLSAQNLEAVYGCAMRELRAEGARFFHPA